MKKSTFRKQLSHTVPDMPSAFEDGLQHALETIESTEKTEANINRKKRSRLSGSFGRKAVLFAVIAVLLVGAAALASTLLQQDVFEVFLGKSPDNAESIMQYDLKKESFGAYDVEIRQAAYDGASLYVVYSIRDRNETELLGVIDTEPDVYYIPREALLKMEESEVGWWGSTFWIDGEPVRIPDLSFSTVRGSETPGEMLFYYLFRLDQANVFPDGKAVEVALPIGQKPSADTLRDWEENGITAKPDAGLVPFTLDFSIRSGVTETHPKFTAELPFGTAEVLDAVYTPIQLYVTLGYTVTPEAMAAFKAEHGEGYENEDGVLMVDRDGNPLMPFRENDVVADWVSSLMLVDADGALVYDAYNPLLKYGLLRYWNEQASFTFPYLETYPEEMYLAPMCGSDADMTQAVRVR